MPDRSFTPESAPRLSSALVGAALLHGLLAVGVSASVQPMPAQRASLVPTIGIDVAWPKERVTSPVVPARSIEAPSSVPSFDDAGSPGPAGGASAAARVPVRSELAPEILSASSEGDESPAAGLGAPGALEQVGGGVAAGVGDRPWGAGAGEAPRGVGKVGAKLLPSSVRCADLFPYGARVEEGKTTISVAVDERGRASFVGLSDVSPAGQGFEAAARLCASRLRFQPAIDEEGRTTAAETLVRLSFHRSR